MAEIKEGVKAPSFELMDETGEKRALKDFFGKTVVLYFYPKDMTSGCTQEACDFRDLAPAIKKKKVVVLGVSKDSAASHQKFIKKHDLNFSLLVDESGKVCEKYGVWKEKSMYGKKYMGIERSTFIIGPDGKIQKIFPKVKVKGHAAEVIESI